MSTKNETSGPQSPIINGNHNVVNFNLNEPLTDKLLLVELSKLQHGDFEDITDNIRTDENDETRYFSYLKNRYFTMRRKTIKDSFYEPWLNFIMRADPSVFEDEISFFYQGCFIKSFLIVVLDGGRFEIPLPKIIWAKDYDKNNGCNKVVGLSDPVVKERFYPLDNHPVEKIVLTEVELTLSNVLSSFIHEDAVLRWCEIKGSLQPKPRRRLGQDPGLVVSTTYSPSQTSPLHPPYRNTIP